MLLAWRRGSCGTAHLYALADLIAAARAKHGSAAGLEAARAARVQGAQQRKAAAVELGTKREQELQEALEPFNVTLK
jgi:hypothetical protein